MLVFHARSFQMCESKQGRGIESQNDQNLNNWQRIKGVDIVWRVLERAMSVMELVRVFEM